MLININIFNFFTLKSLRFVKNIIKFYYARHYMFIYTNTYLKTNAKI
ncbi:hypothetical protein QFZ37_000258 [Chryseobacterium ginsenosidimutans]|nr:hypothetical protein [Chryseobacterium ginsenosidimutans]